MNIEIKNIIYNFSNYICLYKSKSSLIGEVSFNLVICYPSKNETISFKTKKERDNIFQKIQTLLNTININE